MIQPTFTTDPIDWLTEDVDIKPLREALDPARRTDMGMSAFAQLACVEAMRSRLQLHDKALPQARREALEAIVREAIEAIRPGPSEPDYTNPDWRPYIVLDHWFNGRRPSDLAEKLCVEPPEVSRAKRTGLLKIRHYLYNLEQHTRLHRSSGDVLSPQETLEAIRIQEIATAIPSHRQSQRISVVGTPPIYRRRRRLLQFALFIGAITLAVTLAVLAAWSYWWAMPSPQWMRSVEFFRKGSKIYYTLCLDADSYLVERGSIDTGEVRQPHPHGPDAAQCRRSVRLFDIQRLDETFWIRITLKAQEQTRIYEGRLQTHGATDMVCQFTQDGTPMRRTAECVFVSDT
jgi:hypothetical protein